MDIFFQDPGAIPLPPDDVKIVELRAEPWPDNRRVKVYLERTGLELTTALLETQCVHSKQFVDVLQHTLAALGERRDGNQVL